MNDFVSSNGALMGSEIAEQPYRWLDLIAAQREQLETAGQWLAGADYDSLIFVARGTSDHAAMYGQHLYQATFGRPAHLGTPSVSSVYDTNVFGPRQLVVAISQSGASPDLLATLESAHAAGAKIIAFTNNVDSPMATLADIHIDLSAGPELSVAATKTYTAELVALFACVELAKGSTYESVRACVQALSTKAFAVLLGLPDSVLAAIEALASADRVLAIGRGPSTSSAKEAALKLMETCRLPASGWSAADAKHGPIGQVGTGTVAILFTSAGAGSESVTSLRETLTELGASIFMIGGESHDDVQGTLILDLREANVDVNLLPVLEILPAQVIARELSLRLGLNPDQPRGLKKVTTTV